MALFAEQLAPLCETTGLPTESVLMVLFFFLALPIGYVHRYVPTATGKHLYAFGTGLGMQYACFEKDTWNIVMPCVVVYAFMILWRRRCGLLTWIFAFSFLISRHVQNLDVEKWRDGGVDYTGPLMVLVLKLIAVAVCYEDGIAQGKMREAQAYRSLKKLPGPLEFLGYLFFMGTLMTGPFTEFADYRDFTERVGMWKEKRPSSAVPTLKRFLTSLTSLFLYLKLSAIFPVSYAASPDFFAKPVLLKWAIMYITFTAVRFKYYFAWTISEASLMLAGFSYNGTVDGVAKWDRAATVKMLSVETSSSASLFALNWNIQTGNFLRRYVYERLVPEGKKPGTFPLYATQIVSALWHGLFPGYFNFFIGISVMVQISRVTYKWQQKLACSPWSLPFRVVLTGWNILMLSYLAMGFCLMDTRGAMESYASLHYSGHWMLLGGLVLATLIGPPRGMEAYPSRPKLA